MSPVKPAERLDAEALRRCAASPAEFCRVVLGLELWDWQRDIAESPARYRALVGSRQVGKSTLLAGLALAAAWSRPGAQVMVASTIDDAAMRLMGHTVRLARSAPLLRDSVLDDQAHLLKLSNGSAIRSIPSSVRQAIGWTIDVLVADEAAYLEQNFWDHLEPVIAAREGARVIVASTPWGPSGHWFRQMWQDGWDAPGEWCRSWKLPASASPLIDQAWLERKRATMDPDVFKRTYEAEFTDIAGAYFTEAELMSAVADYDLMTPQEAKSQAVWEWEESRHFPAFGGVLGLDWGYSRDASAAVVLSVLDDQGANDQTVFYIPWLEAHHQLQYHLMVDKCVDIARGWRVHAIASELNGPGPMPTSELRRAIMREGLGSHVAGVWTSQRSKQAGFSVVKGGLQRGTLILPRHAGLLAELRGLVYEQSESGGLRIGPAAGRPSPDIAMALMQATRCMVPGPSPHHTVFGASDLEGAVRLPSGAWFPAHPRATESMHGFTAPQGAERRDSNAW